MTWSWTPFGAATTYLKREDYSAENCPTGGSALPVEELQTPNYTCEGGIVYCGRVSFSSVTQR